jgi:tripartite-type tricarboxylate transporter receptor subunit TctC
VSHSSIHAGLIGVAVALSITPAMAQNFPSRPLRILTAEPGGGNDVMARLIANGLTANLGQPVIVDNRPSGPIPRGIVINAAPDGHTVLFTTGGFWSLPSANEKIDVFRDFAPVTLANTQPSILVVHPSSPVNSVKELVALAKAKPGDLNYSSGATGSSSHLATELFKYLAGVDIVRIPYKGAGPAVTGLVSNQVQMMIATASTVTPHIAARRLRALGVSSAKPSDLLPGMPTIASAGVPGYEIVAMFGVFAPGRTPPTLVRRLQQEFARVLHQPEAKEKFAAMGVEVVGSTPDVFVSTIKADMVRMGKVIKAAGIKPE